MQKQELEVRRRSRTGKGEARKLRASGCYPAVCYRKGIDPIPLSLEMKKLEKVLSTSEGQSLIQLKILDDQGASQQEAVILKDLQRDHLSKIQHVDFLAVRMDEAITVESPVKLVGEPEQALREGGIVQLLRRSLDVECLPGDIPESIEVDISALGIGDSIHVEKVAVPEGVRILTDPTETIVVISVQAEEEPEPEAEGEGEETEAGAEESQEEESA